MNREDLSKLNIGNTLAVTELVEGNLRNAIHPVAVKVGGVYHSVVSTRLIVVAGKPVYVIVTDG